MSKHFAYSFLKYTHSLRTDESLNIALLFVFPQENIFRFVYPENLQRLKCAYYDFDEDLVRSFLKAFERTANTLSLTMQFTQGDFDRDLFNSIIRKEFLAEDEGVLRFSNSKVGVKYSVDLEKIVQDIYYSYFEHYFEPEEIALRKLSKEQNRHDEDYILGVVQDLMAKENPLLTNFAFQGREIKTNSAVVRFDFEWLNHGLHLVKPLSLDYKNNNTIEERAHALHSKLHILDLEGESQYKFDIMVSKPQSSKFSSSYDNAVSILKESSKKTTVIQEHEFPAYSKKIAKKVIAL